MEAMKWVRVDRDELNREPRKAEIAGVLVDVFFSSYDLPYNIGGGFDKSKQRFVVKFDYKNEQEPLISTRMSDRGKFLIGKNSRRIYEVELDVDSDEADQIEPNIRKVNEAIQRYAASVQNQPSRNAAHDNYLALSEALCSSEYDLARQFSIAE